MKTIPTIVLAAMLVSLIGCSSGSSTPAMPPVPKTVTVQVLDFSYNPQQVQINAGDTVRWVMAGTNTFHTVTSLAVGAFDSTAIFLTPGDFYEQTFNQNNTTFEYSCAAHSTCCVAGQAADMKGSVLVGAGAPSPQPGY